MISSFKFANVYIFEAIKKDLDARVMEIYDLGYGVFENKNLAFLKRNLVFFCKVRPVPDAFKVSDDVFKLNDLAWARVKLGINITSGFRSC